MLKVLTFIGLGNYEETTYVKHLKFGQYCPIHTALSKGRGVSG